MKFVDRKPGGFKVPAKEVAEIRKKAVMFRLVISLMTGINNLRQLDIGYLIEVVLPRAFGLEIHFVDDHDFTYIREGAPAGVEGNLLYIRDSVYRGMIRLVPRDVFTLFHELGHIFLEHRRILGREQLQEHSWIEDSEWQANWFAGEVLMPLAEIRSKRLFTEHELVDYFGVSEQAASVRLAKLTNRGEI